MKGTSPMMKYFFWIAFAVFLAASIPHVAYFFASFEPSQGPEGIWWWIVSYAIAISIDVTVYLLSWTAFQRYRKYRTPKAVWQHWLLILMCTVFSWAVNWAYAKQFHSVTMLSSAENVAPWLTNVFPFMASAFPLLGIVYTMMAETITETAAEEKNGGPPQLTALSELAKQTQLPMATLRRLTSGSRLNPAALLTSVTNRATTEVATEVTEQERSEPEQRPITGKFVTLDNATAGKSNNKDLSSAPVVSVSPDGNPDKLQMTIEALRDRPDMTDEALADILSLKRPASARFWRLKAIQILNAPGGAPSNNTQPVMAGADSWPATGPLANGASTRRAI
jgi:hypothetical protein